MAAVTRTFTGALSAAIFNAIINQHPVPPGEVRRGLSPKLEEIISKALEKSCDLRCQSAAEVNADLKRLRRELESGATKGTAVRTRQPRQNGRMEWALVITLPVVFA